MYMYIHIAYIKVNNNGLLHFYKHILIYILALLCIDIRPKSNVVRYMHRLIYKNKKIIPHIKFAFASSYKNQRHAEITV